MTHSSLDDYARISAESRLLGERSMNARRLAEEICEHSWRLHVQSEAIHRKVDRILQRERDYLEPVSG